MTSATPQPLRPAGRPGAHGTARAGARAGGFRPDIEGLRAVAVALVLAYHAGLPVRGGYVGVDVFFVISGFLITGLLLREVEATGRVALARFWARRATRLLPATALTLAVTAVGSWLLLPLTAWPVVGRDVAAAAGYVVNWRLAAQSVDYLAEGSGASPVQHFWSLAVEEQFYLVWPLLLVAVVRAVRGRRAVRRRGGRAVPGPAASAGLTSSRSPSSVFPLAFRPALAPRRATTVRPPLAVALAVVAVPSFAWAVHLAAAERTEGFFLTTTRLWELAVGALVAVAARRAARLPAGLAGPLAGAGLAAIAVAGLVFSAATPWPGVATLLPTLGAAAVIVAGLRAAGTGESVADAAATATSARAAAAGTVTAGAAPTARATLTARALGAAPMVAVGGLSYSLYLWHWPAVVLTRAAVGEAFTAWHGVAAVAASVLPAWASHRFVENPVRFSPRLAGAARRAFAVGAACTVAGLVAGAGLVGVAWLTVPRGTVPPGAALGATTVDPASPPEPVARVSWLVPDLLRATSDVPAIYPDGCQVVVSATAPVRCDYGDPAGDLDVAVVGDSKAAQWVTLLDLIGREEGWRVRSWTKSGCAFAAATGVIRGERYTQCDTWNDAVLAELTADPPDLLVTSQRGRTAFPAGPGEPTEQAMLDGLTARWSALREAGVPVVVVLDPPDPQVQLPECVARSLHDLTACAFDRATGVEVSAAGVQRAAAEASGAAVVDLTDWICPGETCAPVVGNVLVYRQSSHLTDTYVRSLREVFRAQLADAGVG